MRIAILTLQSSNNYGAMFQAYALSTFLKKAGHDAFLINYHQDVPTAAGYLRKPFSFLGKIVGKGAISFKFLRGKRIESRGKAVEREFLEVFDQFRHRYLNITPSGVHFAEPLTFTFTSFSINWIATLGKSLRTAHKIGASSPFSFV